jgi:hypothetical protein
MCFSFKTSIITYTIGIASAIFAFCTRQVVLGALILAYSQIQLAEAMIWYGIDNKDSEWNRRGTYYGKYLLPIHNIAIGMGIILAIIFVSKRKLKPVDAIPLLVGALFYIIVLLGFYAKDNSDQTFPVNKNCGDGCQGPGNRLSWPFPHRWYSVSLGVSIIIALIWLRPACTKAVLTAMFVMIFLGSILATTPTGMGSLFCWATAILAPVLVLTNYFMIRNVPSRNILT